MPENGGPGAPFRLLPAKLSGGERQRVAIARALVNTPYFTLADEPTGNMDRESTENIMNLLHEVNQRGTTVIMVTHDAETTAGTRILRIRDRVIAPLPFFNFFNHTFFVTYYLFLDQYYNTGTDLLLVQISS